uniref:Uncharacterized protein n=1 Tax=Salix viminalis TaxID=40686 RepID=A0A6N2L693_SALVM
MEINSYLLACIIFHMMVLSQTSCTVNVALRQPPPPLPTNNGIVHPFPKPPITPGLPGPPPPRRPLPSKVNDGRFPSPPPPPKRAPAPHARVLLRYPPPPQTRDLLLLLRDDHYHQKSMMAIILVFLHHKKHYHHHIPMLALVTLHHHNVITNIKVASTFIAVYLALLPQKE